MTRSGGTSESALQYVLGGISRLGGVSVNQLLTKVETIDNALLRVAAAGGVKIGSEVLENDLQLFLEPLYQTIAFGTDYSPPTMEEILYISLITAINTAIVEGRNIGAYSNKGIQNLVDSSVAEIAADGEDAIISGEMPSDVQLEIMGKSEAEALGDRAVLEMGKQDGAMYDIDSTITPKENPQQYEGNRENISFPTNDAQLRHIFRDKTGHLIDNSENRRKIMEVAGNSSNYLGKDARGNDWYALTLEDGMQMWVRMRNGIVDNAGINTEPRFWDPETGLYNNTKR